MKHHPFEILFRLLMAYIFAFGLSAPLDVLAAESSASMASAHNLVDEACGYQEQVLADNPIAYWRLGELSGTTAENIGSLGIVVDGTYLGGVALGLDGLIGSSDKAAGFNDVSAYVSIPNDPAINTGGPYTEKTFELWFNATELDGRHVLYEQGGIHKGLNIFLDGDLLNVGAWDLETGGWVSTTVTAGVTYYVAMTYDGSTRMVTGYLNGVSFGSADTGHSEITNHKGAIGIGLANDETRWNNLETTPEGYSTGYYNGVIDEVALYNTILPEARIQVHAQGCASAVCYTLTTSSNPAAGGTVAVTPAPNCNMGTQYTPGTVVELTANASTGYNFTNWTGDATGTANPATVTMNGNRSVMANFTQLCYTLATSSNPSGGGTVSALPAPDCNGGTQYTHGTAVQLTANPATGYSFANWSGDATGSTNPVTVTMDGDRSVLASYLQNCYALTVGHTGNGSTPTATPANSAGCAAGQYVYGASISLSGAAPDTGWRIGSWTGTSNDSSTASSNSLVMPAGAHSAGVNYVQEEYTLAVNVVGSGSVSKNPDQATYHYGDVVQLSANAATGWTFSAWSGDASGSTNPLNVTINGNTTITATFTQNCYVLTVGHTGSGSTPTATPANSAGCAAGQYVYGASINLSGATPATGWRIGSWTGTSNDSSTASSNSLTMPAGAHSVSVNYLQNCYALTVGHTGNGSTPTATPANSAGCAVGQYVYGASVSLSGATPATGWRIGSWTGTSNDSSTASSNSLTMPAGAHSVSVNYLQNCYALTVGHTGNGSTPTAAPVNSAGCAAGQYVYGASIRLSGAAPATGWRIGSWTGTSNDSSTVSSNSLVMPSGAHSAGVNYVQEEYPLAVNVVGNGTVSKNPDQATYHYGDVVQLSANAATGWTFSAWSGDASGSTNPLNVTINGNTTITATFTQNCYVLTVGHTGSGSTPTATPANSAGCAVGQYVYGASINLSGAMPATGWRIGGWTGTSNDSSTASSNSLTMPAGAHSASVNYLQNCYALTVRRTGNGSTPTATPANSAGCAAGQYVYGASINLSGATPATGWRIGSWTGTSNDSSTASSNSLLMPAGAHSAGVNYVQEEYTLTVNVVGNGTVSKNPDQATYHYGDVVQLTPNAATGWTFSVWGGDASGSANPLSVTMTGNKTITATFTRDEYTLAINLIGDGSVGKNPDKATYHHGEVVTLTATADPGWTFSGWGGDALGSDNPVTVTMTGNKAVTATFTQNEYTLTVTVVGDGSITTLPLQSTYHYGDVVHLTAAPGQSWYFAGWSGDVSETVPNLQVTITGDTTITATFATHRFYLPIILKSDS